MVSNLVSPTAVEVAALVNFHDILSAAEMFAAKYPDERMCVEQAERLEAAAAVIRKRLAEREEERVRRCHQFLADRCLA